MAHCCIWYVLNANAAMLGMHCISSLLVSFVKMRIKQDAEGVHREVISEDYAYLVSKYTLAEVDT